METGFFKWLWRFNGLLFALAGILIVGILVWELTRDLRRAAFPADTRSVVALAEDGTGQSDSIDQDLSYGAPTHVFDDTFVVPVFGEQTYDVRYVSKSATTLVNYTVVETRTGETRKVFPDNLRVISHSQAIWPRTRTDETLQLGQLMVVFDTDTDGSGQISEDDVGRLVFFTRTWDRPIEIALGVQRITHVRPPEDCCDVSVFVAGPEGTRVVWLDTANGQVTQSHLLPAP